MNTVALKHLNALPEQPFIEQLASLYEYSPWVVERAAGFRPFKSLKSAQAVFESVIYGANEDEQFALLLAHPDLAAKIDQIAQLTDFSRSEQQKAGFAALDPETLQVFRSELEAYRMKFGHPFILCVTEHDALDSVSILSARLQATPAAERLACLAQVARIGWHRLRQLVA